MRPARGSLLAPVLLVPLVLLTACGSDAEPGGGSTASATPSAGTSSGASPGPSSPSGTSSAAPTGEGLVVELDPGDGTGVERYTVTCDATPAGDVPDPAAVCAHLSGLDTPFAGVPDDAVCTEQFGGAQTARVTGTWSGQPVDLRLARTNGCLISQWDRLAPLLAGPAG